MSQKLLFIWVPKCGGSSIYKYCVKNKQINMFKLMIKEEHWKMVTDENGKIDYSDRNLTTTHSDIDTLIKEGWVSLNFYKKSFKFSVVRNPYDRAVSLFFYLKLDWGNKKHKAYSFKEWVEILYKNKHLIPKNSKTSIVHGPIYKLNNQWNTMSSWIPKDIDKIYYLEEIDKIPESINEVLGLNNNYTEKIGHFNKSEKKKKYVDYYDEDTREKIYEIYKEDFIRFNYSDIL